MKANNSQSRRRRSGARIKLARSRLKAFRYNPAYSRTGTGLSPGEKRRREGSLTLAFLVVAGGLTLAWCAFLLWVALALL